MKNIGGQGQKTHGVEEAGVLTLLCDKDGRQSPYYGSGVTQRVTMTINTFYCGARTAPETHPKMQPPSYQPKAHKDEPERSHAGPNFNVCPAVVQVLFLNRA